MSGLEVLGAVSASLQLLDACSVIGQLLLRLPTDAKMADKVEFNCHRLLNCISDSLLNYSPECCRPAHALAVELQSLRSDIERQRRKKFLKTIGSGEEYRQRLFMAITTYNCAATLVMNAASNPARGGCRERSHKSCQYPSDGFRSLDLTTNEMKTCLERIDKKAERLKEMMEELAAYRTRQPIAGALTGHQNPSGVIAPQFGTMLEYPEEIWRSTGGSTSDQDIWECYYDIVSVYKNFQLPVPIRFGFSSPFEGISEIQGLLGTTLTVVDLMQTILGVINRGFASTGQGDFDGNMWSDTPFVNITS